ncbi:alpha-amylase family glycosyl hydrolase [Bacillus sp. REN16]|uniref:alpha-amylase family glycosyl hydrolase n=1 Tax=Bacillus sp. REN16 TaxID=2887296 RepID=UPI001E482E2B|nr:alpha-amylase family glycosyl hydrolase [Bacillus sp. REN16]MCC3355546.1 alpha-amylase [Bacillus sp. REN16]
MKKKICIVALLIPLLLLSGIPALAADNRPIEEESIYYIMVDRFNNADSANDFAVDLTNPNAYYGGDIPGIISRLDYLKDMGFTSILLSPIFENEADTFYPYVVKDRRAINTHYGTSEDLKELVKEAHDKGIKIILDLGITSNETLNDEIVEDTKWWIQETDIDGYKLDLVDGVTPQFITTLSSELKSEKENFLVIGQPVGGDNLHEFEAAGLDSVFNTVPYEGITSFSAPDQTFTDFENIWEQARGFENPNSLLNFFDNPNTVRFTYLATEANEHPAPRLKAAMTYLYTTPGIPVIFYGTEIALNGTEIPDNLGLMDFRTDKELVDYITLLAKIRSGVPALTKGTVELVKNDAGMLVFKREYEGETAFVAINNTTKTQSFTLTSDQVGEDKELFGLITEDLFRSTDDEFHLVVNRDISEVFVARDTTKINYTLFIAVFIVPVLMIGFILLNKKSHGNKETE